MRDDRREPGDRRLTLIDPQTRRVLDMRNPRTGVTVSERLNELFLERRSGLDRREVESSETRAA